MMFSRVLTAVERKKIKSYLAQDGEKGGHIRVIATRAKQFVPTIKSDLDLLEKLLETYTRESD
jgi:hypothetical protein